VLHLEEDLAALTEAVAHGETPPHDHAHDDGHEGAETGHHHDHLAAVAALTDGPTAWMMIAWFALALAPAAIALAWAGTGARLTTLVVGAAGAALGVLDGFAHGIADGHWSAAVAGVVLVGLPAAIAIPASVAWRKEGRTTPVAV